MSKVCMPLNGWSVLSLGDSWDCIVHENYKQHFWNMSMRKIYFFKNNNRKKKPKKPTTSFFGFFLPFSLDSVDMTRDCWKVIDGATGRRGGGRGNWGNYIGGLVRGGSGGEKNKNKKKTQRGGLVSSDFRLGTFPHRTRWVWLAIFTLIIETII